MTDDTPLRQFRIERIVLKDMSFETPMGQEIFKADWQPEYDVSMELGRRQLDEHSWEVVLTTTVTAKLGNDVAFLIEAHQGGVINVEDLDKDRLQRTLEVDAPQLLFPYLREAVDSVAYKGGFPSVGLQTPDFEELHERSISAQPPADHVRKD